MIECENCHDQMHWGCPHDERYKGRGVTHRTDGICPTGLSCEFSRSVLELVCDYEEGRLGDVRETLGSATLGYLRIAKAEKDKWNADKIKSDRH